MSATRATRALERAGVAFETLAYDYDPDAPSVGLQAARALGLDPERLLKTLVADRGAGAPAGRFLCAVVDAAHELDLKALAAACGARRVRLASHEDARRATGYAIGGVSPFGQARRLATFVDAAATALDRVVVNAGRRGLLVRLSPDALVAATGATVAPIRRGTRAAPAV